MHVINQVISQEHTWTGRSQHKRTSRSRSFSRSRSLADNGLPAFEVARVKAGGVFAANSAAAWHGEKTDDS